MRKLHVDDLVYQVATLVFSFLIVHVPYTLEVRPRARAVLEAQARQMRENPEYVQERSWWVIIKDPEQEWEFILCLWALFIMGAKWRTSSRERALLESDLVPIAPGARILPEDAREYARQIQALPEPRAAAAAAARGARRAQPLPRHAQHPGRLVHRARGVRGGVGPARLGAGDDPLHRLGDPLDRLHRHRARHRRRAHAGAPRRPGRHLRRHRGARRRLQLHLRRAAAEPGC